MVAEKKKDWAIYTIRKLVEYGMLISSAWVFGIPWFNQTVDDRINIYQKEHHKESPEALLSREMEIQENKVWIIIGDWYKEQKKHDELIGSVWHILEEEKNSIIPRLVITDENEFWVATDGKYYRVRRLEDGRGSYFLNGEWNFIYW